jgi:hypothetical protein
MKVGLNDYAPNQVSDAMIVQRLNELRRQYSEDNAMQAIVEIMDVLEYRAQNKVGSPWK